MADDSGSPPWNLCWYSRAVSKTPEWPGNRSKISWYLLQQYYQVADKPLKKISIFLTKTHYSQSRKPSEVPAWRFECSHSIESRAGCSWMQLLYTGSTWHQLHVAGASQAPWVESEHPSNSDIWISIGADIKCCSTLLSRFWFGLFFENLRGTSRGNVDECKCHGEIKREHQGF